MADLDARIILGARPIQSIGEMRDQRQQREIQVQEVELRRQEILARRDQMREQAAARNRPKEVTPLERKQALEYSIYRGEVVADKLAKAKENPAWYPQIREWIGRTVGPDALGDLPEAIDTPEAQARLDGLIAEGRAHIQQAKGSLQKVTTLGGPDGKTPVERFVVPTEGAEYPVVPKAETGGANPTEASLALRAAQGDKDAARALALIRGQRVGGGGGSKADNSALVAAVVANPGLFSTLTPSAQTELIPALSAKGFKFPTAVNNKPPTGAQNKVLGFFNRAKQADEDLQGIEEAIANMSYLEQERMKRAPNMLQTQTGQSYNQAQRAFTEARLRKDSGAAIPDAEFENDRKTYFAQPGDSAATLAQKARARAAVLASLAFEAGPALSGFYGDEAGSMVESFKTRAAKGAGGGKSDPLGIR